MMEEENNVSAFTWLENKNQNPGNTEQKQVTVESRAKSGKKLENREHGEGWCHHKDPEVMRPNLGQPEQKEYPWEK